MPDIVFTHLEKILSEHELVVGRAEASNQGWLQIWSERPSSAGSDYRGNQLIVRSDNPSPPLFYQTQTSLYHRPNLLTNWKWPHRPISPSFDFLLRNEKEAKTSFRSQALWLFDCHWSKSSPRNEICSGNKELKSATRMRKTRDLSKLSGRLRAQGD